MSTVALVGRLLLLHLLLSLLLLLIATSVVSSPDLVILIVSLVSGVALRITAAIVAHGAAASPATGLAIVLRVSSAAATTALRWLVGRLLEESGLS